MPIVQISHLIFGSIIIAILGLGGTMLLKPEADMRIEPQKGTHLVGETFETHVVVSSKTPVNVFAGMVHFNPSILKIESIDYNTSIADLWAERPWYENGDGTLSFAGGTTRAGGFFGTGDLITVTFRTQKEGPASINIENVRILKHDGLGSDAILEKPIDAIFAVEDSELEAQTVFKKSRVGSDLQVVTASSNTDLNNDGKQSIADMSIFMRDLATQNAQSDFNGDGTVNTADLSIILNAE